MLESAGHPEAQSEPWAASKHVGVEECRHGHIGRILCGYHEMLAERQILEVICLTGAREAAAFPGGLSHPTLLTRDVGLGTGSGALRPLLAVSRWMGCL